MYMYFVKVLFSKMALEKVFNTQNPLRSWEVGKGSSGAKKWEKKSNLSKLLKNNFENKIITRN